MVCNSYIIGENLAMVNAATTNLLSSDMLCDTNHSNTDCTIMISVYSEMCSSDPSVPCFCTII